MRLKNKQGGKKLSLHKQIIQTIAVFVLLGLIAKNDNFLFFSGGRMSTCCKSTVAVDTYLHGGCCIELEGLVDSICISTAGQSVVVA